MALRSDEIAEPAAQAQVIRKEPENKTHNHGPALVCLAASSRHVSSGDAPEDAAAAVFFGEPPMACKTVPDSVRALSQPN